MQNLEKSTELEKLIQLTPFELTKENLIILASDYKNMVVTRDNLKEANEARLVLYRKRIEIQNVAKANRKTIKDFLKNNNDAVETELIETIEPTEIELQAKITVIQELLAEEKRLEEIRKNNHKAVLDKIKADTIYCANTNDMLYLESVKDTVLLDLEEFKEEGEQLHSLLKQTAKNRLELLEFKEQQRLKQEAIRTKRIELLAPYVSFITNYNEVLEVESEEEFVFVLEGISFLAEQQKNIDKQKEEEQALLSKLDELEVTVQDEIREDLIAEAIKFDNKNSEILKETPKIQTMKTVPIGSQAAVSISDKVEDKILLKSFANAMVNINFPICDSTEAVRHVEYIKNMLSKLSEQTIKVAEKL